MHAGVVASGIDSGSGCAVGRMGGELQELHAQSLIRRCVLKTRTLRMYPATTTIVQIAHHMNCKHTPDIDTL